MRSGSQLERRWPAESEANLSGSVQPAPAYRGCMCGLTIGQNTTGLSLTERLMPDQALQRLVYAVCRGHMFRDAGAAAELCRLAEKGRSAPSKSGDRW